MTAKVPPEDDLFCHCRQVQRSQIMALAKRGFDFNAILAQTGAGGGCGACRLELRDLLAAIENELGDCIQDSSAQTYHQP